MTSTEALQARLEYVEAILAAQTALLAPHLDSLPDAETPRLAPQSRSQSTGSASQQQDDLASLKAFYGKQAHTIMRALGVTSNPQPMQQLQAFHDSYNGSTLEASRFDNFPQGSASNPAGYSIAGPSAGQLMENLAQELGLSNGGIPAFLPQAQSSADPIPIGPSVKRARYASELKEPTMNPKPTSVQDFDEVQTWLNPREGELVPPELMTYLIEEYFARVHPFLPVLHPPAFFAVLSSYYDSFNSGMPESNDASYFSASNSSPPFSSPNRPTDRAKVQTLLHAIVAITINFVDGGNHGRAGPAAAFARGEGRKQELRNTAYEAVIMEAIDNPCFEILQALLIVVIGSIGQGSPPFAWGLAGMVSRMGVQLGLNREATSFLDGPETLKETGSQPFQPFILPANFLPPPRDATEAEHRRRVFWIIFMVDRICAAGTGWSVGLNRRDFSLDLPCSDYLWDNGIASPGRQPSEKSAFRWGPDASVREESDSPRLLIWKEGERNLHTNAELISRNMATSPSNLSFDGENSLPGPVVKLLSEEVRPSNSLKSPIGPGNSEPLGPTACLVEAFEGLSQVLIFIQQPNNLNNIGLRQSHLADLEGSLNAWKEQLPDDVRKVQHFDMLGISHVSPIKAMIHAVSIAATICLHQTFAYPAVSMDINGVSSAPAFSTLQIDCRNSSIVACKKATDEMDVLIGSIMSDLPRMNLFMAFFIFISGRVRLVQITSEGGARNMRSELELHFKALRGLGSNWGLGHYFAEALELGCTFVEATSSSLLPDGSSLGLFDLRISAFSSRIFLASSVPSNFYREGSMSVTSS